MALFGTHDSMDQCTETNHGISMYYSVPYVRGDPRFRAPTKWNYQKLESRPFYDRANFDVALYLEAHSSEIIAEYQDAVKDKLRTHPDTRTEVASGKWQWMQLYGIGGRNDQVCAKLPKTAAVVDSLPINIPFGFVFFSQMSPGTHITRHTGSSNLRIRLHLGVDVPSQEPDGTPFSQKIRVGTQAQGWSSGKVLTFDDAFEHELTYNSSLPRTVLLVDVSLLLIVAPVADVLPQPDLTRSSTSF